jgi:hypothetical protein
MAKQIEMKKSKKEGENHNKKHLEEEGLYKSI